MDYYTEWPNIGCYHGLPSSDIILDVSSSSSASQILHCFLSYQNLCRLFGKGFVV